MHEPQLINPVEHENWNNLLAATPGYSFFYTANWADVLRKSYHYKPLYLCSKGENAFVSLLPVMEVDSPLTGKRGVCLPFTDACEPIAENAQQFRTLFDTTVHMGRKRKWKYLDIRGGEQYLSTEKPAQLFFGHTLDLSCGQQQLFSNLRDSNRRNIKKAQNEKVDVNISNSLTAVREFYRLNAMTRKEHGLPPQPYRFFQYLHDCVIARGMGFIATASLRNRAIAANIYFNFGKDVIYKYGASDKTCQQLRANNLVMWEAIKWSCDRGFQSLSFGRTEPEHTGLLQFKAGWGAQQNRIYYYRYDMRKNAFTANHSGSNLFSEKILSKLPVSVLKMLGALLYRHMG